MPQFLYFVPDARTVTAADLKTIGLGYLGLKGNPAIRGCTGPEGKQGVIFAGDGSSATFAAASQVWTAGPDEKYWVGHATDTVLPAPADLQRKRFVAGRDVEIADQLWTVPICLSIVGNATLPRALAIGTDGKTWQLKQLPEFVALCVAAERVWKEFERAIRQPTPEEDESGTAAFTLTLGEAADIAVQALAVNYRVSAFEATLLGLLTTETCRQILDVMIDWQSVVDVSQSAAADEPEKKSDTPGTSSTGDGAQA